MTEREGMLKPFQIEMDVQANAELRNGDQVRICHGAQYSLTNRSFCILGRPVYGATPGRCKNNHAKDNTVIGKPDKAMG